MTFGLPPGKRMWTKPFGDNIIHYLLFIATVLPTSFCSVLLMTYKRHKFNLR